MQTKRCEYVSRLGVFKNNEHVIVTTIIDLTKAFFGGGGVGDSGGDRGPTGGESGDTTWHLGEHECKLSLNGIMTWAVPVPL